MVTPRPDILALRVLGSIRLQGDLEQDRQDAVKALQDSLRDSFCVPHPVLTAPIHRAKAMHPTQEEITRD